MGLHVPIVTKRPPAPRPPAGGHAKTVIFQPTHADLENVSGVKAQGNCAMKGKKQGTCSTGATRGGYPSRPAAVTVQALSQSSGTYHVGIQSHFCFFGNLDLLLPEHDLPSAGKAMQQCDNHKEQHSDARAHSRRPPQPLPACSRINHWSVPSIITWGVHRQYHPPSVSPGQTVGKPTGFPAQSVKTQPFKTLVGDRAQTGGGDLIKKQINANQR